MPCNNKKMKIKFQNYKKFSIEIKIKNKLKNKMIMMIIKKT